MRRNRGLIVGEKSDVTTSDATGIFDTFDQYNARQQSNWPEVPTLDSISPSTGSITEGSAQTFTATTSGVADGTTLYYTIVQVSGTVTAADWTSNSLTGTFTVTSGTGTFSLTAVQGDGSESDSFKIDIRIGSHSGDLLGSTGTISITDTAGAASDPYTTDYLPITSGLTARLDAKYWAAQNVNSYANRADIKSYIVDTTTYPNGGQVTDTGGGQGHTQLSNGHPYFWWANSTIGNTQQNPILLVDAWSNATNATYGHVNGDCTMFIAGESSGSAVTTGFRRFHRVQGSGGSSLASQTWSTSGQQYYSFTSYQYGSSGTSFTPLSHSAGTSTGRYNYANQAYRSAINTAGTRFVFSLSIDRTSNTNIALRTGSITPGTTIQRYATSGGSGTIGNAPHSTGFQSPNASWTPTTSDSRFIVILNDNLYSSDLWFKIGEVAIYNKYLSSTDHDTVMNHLANKWSV
jgi:hypothetical protein